MFTRPIDSVNGGPRAWLAIKLIAMAGAVTAPIQHRLYWRFCNLLRTTMPSLVQGQIVLALATDCRMKVFLSDPYWIRLIAASYEYEPDFKRVLHQLAALDYAFIDCGANFGYWSILVSGQALGAHHTLAIEASHLVCDMLRENCALNGNRFAVSHTAISDTSGLGVRIDSSSGHARAHILMEEVTYPHVPVVLTSTLDKAIKDHFGYWPQKLLVKLDVEGQEINAFKGASELLNRDVLFYYEDHGNDPSAKVTRYVLETLGLTVLYCPPVGPLQVIESVNAASKIKTRKTVGYNFLACRAESEYIDALKPLL